MFSRPAHKFRPLSGLPSLRQAQLLLAMTLFTGVQVPSRVWAAPPAAGFVIENQATGSFLNPNDGSTNEIESNIVQVTVAEIAGVTLVPAGIEEAPATHSDAGPNQADGSLDSEDVVYFLFTATNVGNDPTQFFIPGAPSALTNGTLAGAIEIIERDSDGVSGPTAPVDFSGLPRTIRPEGNQTGDTTVLGLPVGSIPAGGSITVRVPVKVDAGLSNADSVAVTLGEVGANDNSGATQNQDYEDGGANLDFYTQDNSDMAAIADEATGNPVNGDATFHRREASANSRFTIGDPPSAIHQLSGFVFRDGDGSDAMETGEVGLNGVTVRLYADRNNDGQLTDADDNDGSGFFDTDDAIATTITNASGFYQFHRPDGNYLVEVDLGDSDLTGFSYGGVTGVADDPLNTPRNADINGAALATGLDFPFDRVVGPPIIDLDGDDSSGATGFDFQNTFTAGGPAVAAADIDVDIDDEGTIITSAVITLTNRLDGDANELLSITDGSGNAATAYDPDTGTITLSGNATLAAYEAAIQTLTYDNLAAAPTLAPRVITVQVTDLNGFDSNVAQGLIDVRLLTDIVPNPDLSRSCGQGMRIALILDLSQSIQGSEVDDVNNGTKNFLNQIASIAPGNVEVGIVEFGTVARLAVPYTSVTTTTIANQFSNYLDDPSFPDRAFLGDRTNWEAAFQTSIENFSDADVFVFITDGDPNEVNNDDGTTADSLTVANAINQTVPWTNQAKFQGTHIFAVGITNGVTVPANFHPLIDGPTNSEEFNGSNAQTADYLGINSFTELGATLGDLPNGLCGTTTPNVHLVKRITAINGNSVNGTINLASYDPDLTFPYDDNTVEAGLFPPDTDKWPNTTAESSSTFLIGARDGGETLPGDEIEYTIYFLSAGTATANSVVFCDRIPDGQTFVPDAFNSMNAAANSIGEAHGIVVNTNATTLSYSNIGGDDIARFYPPGSGLPPACNTLIPNTEDNGAIVVNLGNLPQATAPGTPADSYGFVRFRATVKDAN